MDKRALNDFFEIISVNEKMMIFARFSIRANKPIITIDSNVDQVTVECKPCDKNYQGFAIRLSTPKYHVSIPVETCYEKSDQISTYVYQKSDSPITIDVSELYDKFINDNSYLVFSLDCGNIVFYRLGDEEFQLNDSRCSIHDISSMHDYLFAIGKYEWRTPYSIRSNPKCIENGVSYVDAIDAIPEVREMLMVIAGVRYDEYFVISYGGNTKYYKNNVRINPMTEISENISKIRRQNVDQILQLLHD